MYLVAHVGTSPKFTAAALKIVICLQDVRCIGITLKSMWTLFPTYDHLS